MLYLVYPCVSGQFDNREGPGRPAQWWQTPSPQYPDRSRCWSRPTEEAAPPQGPPREVTEEKNIYLNQKRETIKPNLRPV